MQGVNASHGQLTADRKSSFIADNQTTLIFAGVAGLVTIIIIGCLVVSIKPSAANNEPPAVANAAPPPVQEKAKPAAREQRKNARPKPVIAKKHQWFTPTAEDRTKQPARLKLIGSLRANRFILKLEQYGNTIHVHVGSLFYMATFDEKKKFMNVILAYYATDDPSIDMITIKDGYSGKRIGYYYPMVNGLKLY